MTLPFCSSEYCQRVISPERLFSRALYSASSACFMAAPDSCEPRSPASGPLASCLYFGFVLIQTFLKPGIDIFVFDEFLVSLPYNEQAASIAETRTGNEKIRILGKILWKKYIQITINSTISYNVGNKGKQ